MKKILITVILSMTVTAPGYGLDLPSEKEKATTPVTTNSPSNEQLQEKDGGKGPSEKMLPVIRHEYWNACQWTYWNRYPESI